LDILARTYKNIYIQYITLYNGYKLISFIKEKKKTKTNTTTNPGYLGYLYKSKEALLLLYNM